jgi:hypothetical protein
MEKITLHTVLTTITELSIRYPESNYTPAQIAVIAKGWYEDCVDVGLTENDFKAASRKVRKFSRFFPKFDQILEETRIVFAERRRADELNRSKLMIEEYSTGRTEEELAQDKRRVKIIEELLAGKLSMDEAERQQNAIAILTRR